MRARRVSAQWAATGRAGPQLAHSRQIDTRRCSCSQHELGRRELGPSRELANMGPLARRRFRRVRGAGTHTALAARPMLPPVARSAQLARCGSRRPSCVWPLARRPSARECRPLGRGDAPKPRRASAERLAASARIWVNLDARRGRKLPALMNGAGRAAAQAPTDRWPMRHIMLRRGMSDLWPELELHLVSRPGGAGQGRASINHVRAGEERVHAHLRSTR